MLARKLLGGSGLLVVGLLAAGCGKGGDGMGAGDGSALKGSVTIDGSSTVFPVAQAFAEDFNSTNKGVVFDVTSSGTGSGMAKFARGEIDIVTASRPIEQDEIDACERAGIEFVEVPIAADGLCVLVSSQNRFAAQMTVDELTKAFQKGSTVKTWADIRAGWPSEKINFYSPTSNHGTFDYFTEAICGEKGNQRDDVQQNQDYNALITAIAGDRNALGYVGFAYYQEKKDQAKAVAIGPADSAVAPSPETIANNSYAPLSRPLFLYVNKKALDKPEVAAFLEFALGEGRSVIEETNYVELPADAYDAIKKNVDQGVTGSKFKGVEPGTKITDVLSKN